MIKVDLRIETSVINAAAQDEIKELIRKALPAFIGQQVDYAAQARGYHFNHKDIHIDGTIQVSS